LTAFGREAVETVLRDPRWTRAYSAVIEALQSKDELAKAETILPGDLVFAIAGRDECVFDFYGSPDGDRLYARYRHEVWPEPRAIDKEIERQRLARIPSQEALGSYGAYCLFMAADNVYGRRGDRDPRAAAAGSQLRPT
jgi:hypothetical protein